MAGYGVQPTLERPSVASCERRLVAALSRTQLSRPLKTADRDKRALTQPPSHRLCSMARVFGTVQVPNAKRVPVEDHNTLPGIACVAIS